MLPTLIVTVVLPGVAIVNITDTIASNLTTIVASSLGLQTDATSLASMLDTYTNHTSDGQNVTAVSVGFQVLEPMLLSCSLQVAKLSWAPADPPTHFPWVPVVVQLVFPDIAARDATAAIAVRQLSSKSFSDAISALFKKNVTVVVESVVVQVIAGTVTVTVARDTRES